MGDAYRGLTIRIGADYQPLQRALSGISSAARSTSKEVSRITKALKQDPGNSDLVALKIRALGDQSKAAATQVAMLQRSISQTLSGYKGGKGNLSAMLKDAESNAANAKRQFNSLDASLEGVYDTIAKYNVAVNGMSGKEAAAALRQLRTEARNSRDEVGMLERELRRVWTSDKSLIPFGSKDVDAAIAKWKELRAEQQQAQREYEAYSKFAGLKSQVVDLELAKAEAKQLRMEAISTRNAFEQLGSSKGARNAVAQQRLLAESTKEAEASFRSMLSTSQALPRSVEAAAARTRSFSQVARLLEQQIGLVESRLRSLDGSGVAKVEREFVTTANAVRVLTSRAGGLEREIESIDAEMLALREHMMSLDAGSAEFRKCENAVRELNARLETTEGKLYGVNAQLRNANKAHAFRTAQDELVALNGQLATHQATLAQASRKWGQLGASIRTAGYSVMATVGATAMIGGMYAIQAAKDIDSAYRDMRKTVNGTEEDFEHLKDAALEFSQTHFTSADQILSIEAIGGQLGIQVQNLEKFAEVVSSIDIATNLDTDTISQNLGQLTNIMNDMDQDLQEGPGSMEAYGDALVRLGNNTAAQEDKIQNVMMRIASMGTICGMSTPRLLALSAATAATGQGAEAAGTALSKTFSGIESAVNGSERALSKLQDTSGLTEDEISELTASVESGQGKLERFAEVAGMSADEFKAAWNETPMEAFQAFIQGLKDIDAAGGSVDSTLTGLGITSVRQKQTLQGLTQTVGILGDSIVMADDAWNGISDQWGAAGDAAREAQRKSEGFSGQLEMMKNNAKVLADVFLESLTPALSAGNDVLRSLVDGFEDLPDGVKQAVVGATALAALAGPMMIFSGTTLAAGSSLKSFFSGQRKGWTVTKDALSAGGDALLVTSTLLDRHGRAAERSGTRAQRLGDRLLGAAAKVDSFSARAASGSGALSKLSDGLLVAGEGVATMSGAVGGGIAVFAGLAAVCALSIASLSRYTESTDMAKQANGRLADSSKTLAERTRNAFASISGTATSALSGSASEALATYGRYVDGVVESQSKLADEAEDMGKKVLGIRGAASDASTLLGRLGESGSLTELEFQQLTAIMDNYNQMANDSIQVMRDEDGKIRVLRDGVELTADAFNDLAKAKENAAKADYFSKAYNTAFENKVGALQNKQGLEQQRDAAWSRLQDFKAKQQPGQGASWQEWQAYNEQLALLEDTYNALAAEASAAAGSVDEFSRKERAAAEMAALLKSDLADEAGTLENLIAKNDDYWLALSESSGTFSDFKAIVDKAGISVDQLEGKDLAVAFRNWDGSLGSLVEQLVRANAITDKQRDALEGLSLLTIDGKHYFIDDDGTIQWQEDQLRDLQDIVIDGKHYYVTDDGTVYDEQGKCDGFDLVTIDDKHYMVTDDGSMYDAEGRLQQLQNFQLDGKALYVSSDGLVTAEGQLYAFNDIGIDPKEFIVDDDGTVRLSEDKVESLRGAIAKVPTNVNIHLTATDDASRVIANVMSSIANGTVPAATRNGQGLKQGGHAAGGFVRLHAAGAFITDGPTYIGSDRRGVRHIAGEAGREFVQRHADGTTSIIPLQNRKYMAPFVSAVADMLASDQRSTVSRDDLYKVADAVIRSNQQRGDIVLVLDDREIARLRRGRA